MKDKSSNIHTTEESFRVHLKRRACLMSLYILTGVALLIWVDTKSWNAPMIETHEYDYTRNFFRSFSVAIATLGAVKLIRTIRCLKYPEKFQKAYTDYTDERNRFVLMKSYYYSAYIFILLMAVAIIVINFLGMPPVISNTLGVSIGVFALLLTVTYRIMNRIY